MSFAATAVTLGAVSLAASVGEYAYSAATQPQAPNLNASSAQMANVEASLLPQEAALQKEAELGGTALNAGYTKSTQGAIDTKAIQNQISQLQGQLSRNQSQQSQTSGGLRSQMSPQTVQQIQSQITQLQNQLKNTPAAGSTIYLDSSGKVVPESQAVSNFAGNSTADIQGTLMQQQIQGQLANAAQYDPQFIANKLAEEQQANPQGVAARADLYDQIQKQINTPPTSPVADTMNQQVQTQVNAGSGLTPEEQAALDSQVGAQGGNNPNFSTALTTGFAGQTRAQNNANEGASWLSSGETPADIQYRAEQQNLANLSSYISGQTPESQFSQLSGAQSTATPSYSNTPQPSFNLGAGQQGQQAAITQYGQQTQQAESQANPWSAGLSSVLGVGRLAASAGY
jgi:hypothetical protein